MRHPLPGLLVLLALPVALAIALAVGPGPSAAGASPGHAPTPVSSTVGLAPPTSPDGDPPGANDWRCRPTKQRPEPVILVHGTFGDRQHLLGRLSASVKRAGFCVFSLDYGNRATGDIRHSAHELKRFTGRVLRATGARRVSMVGHSQGGMMPRYYIKFLGGARRVDDLVGLSPSNHGTTIATSGSAGSAGSAGSSGSLPSCRACTQQAAGSAFLRHLNAGDETPGRVSYTQITTRYDEVVVPYRSAYLEPGPRTTNITLQDKCPLDTSEHLRIPTDPAAIAIALDALERTGPAKRSYQPPCS